MSASSSDSCDVPSGGTEKEIDRLFRAAVKLEASDLHLKVNLPPLVRVAGELRTLDRPPVGDEEMLRLLTPLLTPRRRQMLEESGGADFAYTLQVEAAPWRFRVNVFRQLGHLGMAARRATNRIPTFAELHLPPALEDFCKLAQGMVLVSGITGAGKSTTLASMLDWINHRYRKHVLTLEDPVEFVFSDDKCVINQREIGEDVRDFNVGIRQAVREDPDVILVGEMRDRVTFETALRAAETGHLVFGTVHASSAASTIVRIMELFPADTHAIVRSSLAYNLKAILSQKLLPSSQPDVGRVPAMEILRVTPIVRKLILEGQDAKLADAIRVGREEGMLDFTASLKDLIDRDLIDHATALEFAPSAEALKMALRGIEISRTGIL